MVSSDARMMPGNIVGSMDGQPWLVLSSLNTKDGTAYKLADLMGKPISTPPHFDPVPLRFARIASLLKLAFNKDFDEYVKAYIRQANLPVDPTMNWAKYLYTIMASRLGTHDEELIDEATHFIIIRELGERKKLDPNNPEGFTAKIKEFGWREGQTESLPMEKQVTEFLKKSFQFRVDEARKYVKRLMGLSRGDVDEDSFMSLDMNDTEGEGAVDLTPIETMEAPASQRGFELAEQNIELGDYRGRMKDWDMGGFSKGFFNWMEDRYRKTQPDKRKRNPEARQYMRLLTLIHDETKSVGKMPKLKDIERRWVINQNKDESSRNRLDKDGFLRLFLDLPVQVELYVRTHFHGQENLLPTLIRVLNHVGRKKVEEKVVESKRDREERQRDKEERQKDKEVADAADQAAATEVESAAKTSAQQWVPPTCFGCGTGNEVRKCKRCEKYLCHLCEKDHHANNPSHDGVV